MSKPTAPLMWVDEWGCINTMQPRAAQRLLKKFYDEWPGGLKEIEFSIAGHKRSIVNLQIYLYSLGKSEEQIDQITYNNSDF